MIKFKKNYERKERERMVCVELPDDDVEMIKLLGWGKIKLGFIRILDTIRNDMLQTIKNEKELRKEKIKEREAYKNK